MNARELGVGNIVLCDYDLGEVIEIMQEQIKFRILNPKQGKDDIHVIHLNNVHPIPLTRDMLTDCGFVSQGFGEDGIDINENSVLGYWRISPPIIMHYEVAGEVSDISTSFQTKFPHIKNLHQLQNLYFAMTGNELNYQNIKQQHEKALE
jgi:hypothetical protein